MCVGDRTTGTLDEILSFWICKYLFPMAWVRWEYKLIPDDIILPFAYSQALLARQQYSEAAAVLRHTLANVSPDKEGVFYPRGLYSDDDVLFEQINLLAERAELYSFDPDLQLLLGYQLLGIGKLDEAVEPLQNASLDMENAVAATTLLNLLEKIRAENSTVESVNQ